MILVAVVALGVLASTGSQLRFAHGLPTDPSYFPIAVWLQEPANAPKFKAAGFNLYVGLWQGPNEEQLSRLKREGIPVICEQNAVGLAHRNDATIVGWMHQDEPDNAQPLPGNGGYGPCVPPQRVVDEYRRMHAADNTRPVLLNLGQGVANDEWIGRGSGAQLSDYAAYVKGGDIVSFDVYPIAGLSKPNPENYLWYVPKGLDRLAGWMGNRGARWNCIECTRIDGDRKATPAQVRSEVWMSLIHGSRGLIYFVHQFKPTFDEHALLDDPEMLAAVTKLNAQIRSLAPMLNAPTLADGAKVTSSSKFVAIDLMTKRVEGALYIFAVAMRNGEARGSFTLPLAASHASAEVLGENRTISVVKGRFTDSFAPYQVHLYRVQSE